VISLKFVLANAQ